ncbi:30S ribosomal protein S20 [Enterococcus faecalis]|nr:30S ribosomal protein S20 [Enterococcus faecalis]
MPNIESAIKRVRTSANANAKNSSQTNAMRTAIKKFEEAVAAGAAGADNVDALYNEAVKAVDMAATKGLIHKNKANRDKIRLSKLAK